MPSKTGLDYEDYRDGFVPDKGGPYNDDQFEQLFQEAYNDSYFLSNIIVTCPGNKLDKTGSFSLGK